MYCPRCLVEYREGFTLCADCRVKLKPGVPPPPDPPEPDVELVTVLETSDPVLLSLARSTLEETRIEFTEKGAVYLDGARPSYMLDWFGNAACILVRQEDEAKARELLQSLTIAKS
ncbi:conserved hypothetical protein [Candidatus Sulfopaludibacter sp. SbA3]|nr:conserved hypothetical protein [Candidatus Sulfopaludibacter sp. SbA3]